MFFEKRRSQKKLYESLIRWDWLVLPWLGLAWSPPAEESRLGRVTQLLTSSCLCNLMDFLYTLTHSVRSPVTIRWRRVHLNGQREIVNLSYHDMEYKSRRRVEIIIDSSCCMTRNWSLCVLSREYNMVDVEMRFTDFSNDPVERRHD